MRWFSENSIFFCKAGHAPSITQTALPSTLPVVPALPCCCLGFLVLEAFQGYRDDSSIYDFSVSRGVMGRLPAPWPELLSMYLLDRSQ